MTPADLARLRELEAKATKGPWQWDRIAYVLGKDSAMVADRCHSCDGVRIRGVGGRLPMAENAELIAALRNAAPALLSAAERLEQIRTLLLPALTGARWLSIGSIDNVLEIRMDKRAVDELKPLLLDAPTPKGEA